MAVSKFDVASEALVLVGEQGVSDFTGNDAQTIAVSSFYEPVVEAELSVYPWRFAMKQAELTRDGTAPEGRWSAQYVIPTDALLVRAITVEDIPIEYDIYGNRALCNATTNDTLVMDYTYRPDETRWPGFFREVIVYRLATRLSAALSPNPEMMPLLSQAGDRAALVGRAADSQSKTTRRVRTTRFIGRRY